MNPAFWGGTFLAVLSTYLLWHALKSFLRFEASKRWPAVTGRIISSEVVAFSADSERHDYLLHYEYQVGGVRYQGNRATLYPILQQEEAEKLAQRFTPGLKVAVHYDPTTPAEATLITGGKPGTRYGELILAGVSLLVGVAMAAYGLRA
ncbi:DUF3592 domain-containing protein [Pseudomonas benzenivorans]|uniref:DUF3592 domain-containing protein n=1 Tax=Pseudomonas benzenivorans TaxID=556533 RepID=A0ABY5H8B6_9PSED|nr:DUF3592 domain-containing protein [Pseudomonas benzenivorans]UTW08264.1 DUF3592 domain-containing protein [Pseudomonas benzenivorans]